MYYYVVYLLRIVMLFVCIFDIMDAPIYFTVAILQVVPSAYQDPGVDRLPGGQGHIFPERQASGDLEWTRHVSVGHKQIQTPARPHWPR